MSDKTQTPDLRHANTGIALADLGWRGDFQQQLVIRRMVEDLSLPIRIVTGPTVRDEDGVALSSRNQYLSEEERAVAPVLYQALQNIVDEIESGNRNYEKLEKKAASDLESAGFFPEYVSIRRAANLEAPDREQDKLVVLAAARLGAAPSASCSGRSGAPDSVITTGPVWIPMRTWSGCSRNDSCASTRRSFNPGTSATIRNAA